MKLLATNWGEGTTVNFKGESVFHGRIYSVTESGIPEYNAGCIAPSKYSTSYILAPSVDNVTVPSDNSDYPEIIQVSKTIKMIRILGLMALISYMTVILFTWIDANLKGYVYFSAGEPMSSIKYSEWALGFTGIFAAVNYLVKEIRTV